MDKAHSSLHILVATGIYPPDIGGPSQYAKNLEAVWRAEGHLVAVRFFRFERRLPAGFRHVWYFFKILPAAARADIVFALDTFSAAVPAALAARLFGKPLIVRVGGDFLWEGYVERTNDLVLLRNFYESSLAKLSGKERLIFRLTRFVMRQASAIVFSTIWQKAIWQEPYRLTSGKIFVVENYYGPKEKSFPPAKKNFLAGTRPLKWKNQARLKEAFSVAMEKEDKLEYDNTTTPFDAFMDKLARSYAVILPSLGDVSPNLILDAIRHDKPFILTRETGLYERVKSCALFVDPESVTDIAEKILRLSLPEHYAEQKKKIEAFTFKHSWQEIAAELLAIFDQAR